MKRIEICGGIASGKTTLALLLGAKGFETLHENFRENPFWTMFFQRSESVAFEAEVTFLLQHYHQWKIKVPRNQPIVSDFSFLLDRSYSKINLNDGQLEAFQAVYRQVATELSTPTLVVRLNCSANEELRRIRARARIEESSISLTYLARLNDEVGRQFHDLPATVRKVDIDSESIDFAHDGVGKAAVVSQVMSALNC